MARILLLLLLYMLLPSCELDDEPPDYYVEALPPDLYFTVPLQYEAVQATVLSTPPSCLHPLPHRSGW